MWTGLHELEKIHSAPIAQQERQPRHQIPSASVSHHESMRHCGSTFADRSTAQNHIVNSWTRVTCRTDRMSWALEEITHPTSCNLCSQEFGDLQTYHAHVRLTDLPLESATVRESRHAQLARQPRRHRQHSRSGHEREPRIHQEGRQTRRRGAAKAASTNRQPNQAARRRGQRFDDSGTQAQGGRQGRAEESQQDHAQGHPQDASDDARLNLNGVGHSPDQGVEPRSGQHVETDADLHRKGAARGTRIHTRPTYVWAYLGLVKSLSSRRSNAVGARTAQGIATYWARLEPPSPTQMCDEVRFCKLDKTYKADIKIITLNIVSPEKRLLVLEALGQTEAERKYGWSLPTAMHGTRATDLSEAFLAEKGSAGKQQGVAQRHAQRARTTHGNRLFSDKTYLKVLGAGRSLAIEPLVKRAKRHVDGVPCRSSCGNSQNVTGRRTLQRLVKRANDTLMVSRNGLPSRT